MADSNFLALMTIAAMDMLYTTDEDSWFLAAGVASIISNQAPIDAHNYS